ncbi:MAG: hypothetical protein SGARI_004078 [Bacillariaceae sp.]
MAVSNNSNASPPPPPPPPQSQELWKAAERAVQEIEALEAIYGHTSSFDGDDGEDSTYSSVVVSSSRDDLNRAQTVLESMDSVEFSNPEILPTEFVLEIQMHLDAAAAADGESSNHPIQARIRIRLPVGYPEYQAACVTSIKVIDSTTTKSVLKRAAIDEIVNTLNDKAKSLVGVEAVMDIVETAKDMIADTMTLQLMEKAPSEQEESLQLSSGYGRRWIWVHHITNTERRKSILKEARAMHLGGYLKYGYPGIIVVEGTSANCNEFVGWIKGNKSRPGGFGRNWGHHVRAEAAEKL